LTRIYFRNCTLLDPEAPEPVAAGLLVEDDRIVARIPAAVSGPDDAEQIDLAGAYLAPGFVDLHYHGALQARDDAAGVHDALMASSASLARSGTTAFLATTLATPQPALTRALTQIAASIGQTAAWPGALPIGIHLEGPWIDPGAAGAQPRAGIRPYRAADGDQVLSSGAGLVRLATFAPEVEGASELQKTLAKQEVRMALGHSRASAEQSRAGVERGATHVTHLFNAMGTLHQRRPGLLGVALSDDRLTCDLICDGAHVDAALVKLSARAKPDRLVLISDRIDASGASSVASSDRGADTVSNSESFASFASLGGQQVRYDGVAYRLPDGRLAGSALCLDDACRNLRRFAGVSLLEAVAAATLRPARVIGVEREHGTLRVGSRADLLELDAEGRLWATWVGGVRRCGPRAA